MVWNTKKLKGSNDGLIAKFAVKFNKGFEWGCRGKVGGFFIGPGQSSGKVHSVNGASHRLMWNEGGGAYAYVYVPKGTHELQTGRLRAVLEEGTDFGRDYMTSIFPIDTWVNVEIGVKLNTMKDKKKPNADGKLWLKVGNKSLYNGAVVWRTRAKYIIERFGFNVFHGGPKRVCDAKRSSSMDIANVQIHKWGAVNLK